MNKNNFFVTTQEITGRKLRHLGRAGIVLGIAMLAAMGTSYANDDSRGSEDGGAAAAIEGTWALTVKPPGNFAPPHIVLGSFARGGVFTGSPDPYLPPVAGTTGDVYGNWLHTKQNQYASTFAAPTHNAGGMVTGFVRFDAAYQIIDDDKLEGRSYINICDLSLNCTSLGSEPAVITGTRLPIFSVKGTELPASKIKKDK